MTAPRDAIRDAIVACRVGARSTLDNRSPLVRHWPASSDNNEVNNEVNQGATKAQSSSRRSEV
jgi:hypothetical protein